jgi:hypothetical protein
MGSADTLSAGSGATTVYAFGSSDVINSGGGGAMTAQPYGATNATFVDQPTVYADTIIGFNNAAGDTIHLTGSDTSAYALAHTSPANGGQDTQIQLNDGSTILLKGVTSVTSGFFS